MAQEIADSKLLDTWGSSGTKIEPDISKIIEGWQLGEQPPHEYMNWLQNTFGSKLNHILKNGVASWNNETEYLAGATKQHNGSIWICQETNVNSEPTELNNNWDKIPSIEDLALTVDTIDDFPAGATTGDTCIVKDLDRGGIFIYDSTKVSEHNEGTNFNGWIRQYSGAVNIKWFGAKGDSVTDDTVAIQNAINLGLGVNGIGLTYKTSILPSNFLNLTNIAFLYQNILYSSQDYLSSRLSQITKTPTYTGWAQDKSFSHKGGIYVPIMLAHGHTTDTTRLAWIKSFDDGNTWTTPEILLDRHTNPSRGWNSFSAGVIANRFVMIVEERDNNTETLISSYIYDKILSISEVMVNSISLTSGSSIATITLPNHGLVAGDKVSFSGVSGTDVGGLTGILTVIGNPTPDTFTVDKGSVSSTNQSSTGGSGWFLGATFYNNDWRITPIGTLPDINGNPITHIHSFTVKNENSGELFLGFHNGSGSREVGVLHITNFWSSPTVTKKRLPSGAEASQAEPSVGYYNGKLYLTTRGQSNTSNGSLFATSLDDGSSWTWARFPNNLHYSPLPFVVNEDTVYIFGTERAENEWDSSVDNRYTQNRPRSFLLTAKTSELESGNFSNMTTTLLGYGIYAGEQVSSASGVGSAILHKGTLRYYFGSEDYSDSTRYSLNFPSVDDEYIGDGYQPDIFEYRIDLNVGLAGVNDFNLRAADNKNITVYKNTNGKLEVQPPLTYKNTQNMKRVAVGSTSSVVGDVEDYVNAKVEGSAYIIQPYTDTTYWSTGNYAAIAPSTSVSGDTKYSMLMGGGSPSSSRGAMILAYGANHGTAPNEARISSAVGLSPTNDNVQILGRPSGRWSTVYAGTGAINTSDDREKTYIDITEAEKQVAVELKANMKKFKFNDAIESKGEKARLHFGTSAQTVKSIFEKYGLNGFDYAILCYDEWEEQEEVKDEEGNIIESYRSAGSRYGIRYEELLCFIISAM